MKKTFKLTLLSALLGLAGLASAQSYSLTNSGRIDNHVGTFATVDGTGSSYSVAKGSASSAASGYVTSNPIAGGQALTLGGAVETTGSAMAFNISTGNATGNAYSNGWSDANVNGYNDFSNQHGSIGMAGSTDSGMTVPVLRGPDFSVVAGRNQDGFAQGADGGSFNIAGQTQQLPVAGGATVAAWVSDTKESHASASAGRVEFTDGAQPYNSAAATHSNAGNVTDASAHYTDPIGQ